MILRIWYIVILGIIMGGCSNSNDTTPSITKEGLVGTWIIKMIDDVEIYTNEYFVCRYNVDNSEEYFCVTASEEDGGTLLTYTNNTTFKVSDNTIYLSSDTVEIELEAKITVGEIGDEEGDILIYTEKINIQDNTDMGNNRTFKGIRVLDDYSTSIVGMWEGEVIDGDLDEPFDKIRIQFRSNQTYDFYCLDDSGAWTLLEQDNRYYVFGNILGSQWSEEEGTIAEIWVIEIVGDTMTWRANREGSASTSGFNLVRIV